MPERRVLDGRRIVVTRAGEAGERLAMRLRDLGAVPIVRPLIAIVPPADPAPLDAALRDLSAFDWLVCTSANAVVAVVDRLQVLGGAAEHPVPLRVGAVGDATAAAFRDAGWRVDLVPATQSAAGLVTAFGDVAGRRVLFPASAIAQPTLADGLRAHGATVTTVEAYRTATVPPLSDEPLAAALRAGTIDAVTFTSPSTVRGFLPFMADVAPSITRLAIVCVGPTTADAACAAGLPVSAVAAEHSTSGLLDALIGLFDRSQALADLPHESRGEVQL